MNRKLRVTLEVLKNVAFPETKEFIEHNMKKVCEKGELYCGRGNFFRCFYLDDDCLYLIFI